MSRLGDQIKAERLRKCVSIKQVAKKCGLTVNFLTEVEDGRRIVNDDVASRILKYLGVLPDREEDLPPEMQTPTDSRPPLPSPSEQIAKWLDEKDLEEENPLKPAQPRVKRRTQAQAQAPVKQFDIPPHPDTVDIPPAPALPETQVGLKTQAQISEAWIDALSGVLKRVPVLSSAGTVVDHRVMPVMEGKIAGHSPDKVMFFKIDDEAMAGFRMRPGDIVLAVPQQKPVDGALMLINIEGFYCVRKVRKVEGNQVLLSSFDRDQHDVLRANKSVGFVGQCVEIFANILRED